MIRSLYISYNAVTEPIVQSQVIPYLKELSKKGIKFCLLTYEKRREAKKDFFIPPDIKWYGLKYHKNPTVPATIFDIVIGCIYAGYIILKERVDDVHARAIMAALAGFPASKLLGRKFIFDTRGIDSEEYVDGGLWKRGGLKHKIVSFLEGTLTRSANRVIVLTNKFSEILKKRYNGEKINFSVVPCAADTDKFRFKSKNTK